MSGPWGLISTYFNSLGGNISESEKARKQAELEQEQNRQPGYQYDSAPDLDRSNFQAGSPATVGANLIGDYGGVGKQLFGKAVAGEADMYAPQMSAQGGTAMQPTKVDSSKSPYQNSALAQYLNFLSYRGGY